MDKIPPEKPLVMFLGKAGLQINERNVSLKGQFSEDLMVCGKIGAYGFHRIRFQEEEGLNSLRPVQLKKAIDGFREFLRV